MSKRHPVVAVTGSSGAGTSTVKRAFEHIFAREDIVPAVVEGDSYHRFERMPMKKAMADALSKGENFSHFGPEANLFDKLEELFKIYGNYLLLQLREQYLLWQKYAQRLFLLYLFLLLKILLQRLLDDVLTFYKNNI